MCQVALAVECALDYWDSGGWGKCRLSLPGACTIYSGLSINEHFQ